MKSKSYSNNTAGAVAPAATCSRDWWVVDRNADDAKINGPHGSAETAGSVRHVLELNASDEQNERWNLCLKRIPENAWLMHPPMKNSESNNNAPAGRMKRLVRPYFLLDGVSEVPLSQYQGMKVGLPPICICCRRATDGPASGCAEALCFECYELVRTRGSILRTNANVDLPDTAAQDSASKSNNPAVSG